MATPNVGILTNAGKNLIDRVNAGQAKITFTKIVFSSMDNSQLTDDKIRALTTVTPQEVVVNNPEVTLDNSTGETRIRATGTNEKLDDGVYVKTYGVFAKDDTGNEILYGLTVSPNPNYFPAYDGLTPQVVTYSYKVNISNTSNITFTNSSDIYLSETDLGESLKPYAKIVYVNQQLDKVVHKTGTEEIAGQKTFDIAPIDKTTDNPYITKSDIPSDLARTGSNQEFTGKNTFDTAPIDKTTGNPYITKDGVPSLPSDLARTGQSQTFTAAQTFSIAPTIKDASKDKGDNQAATMADLKSVEKAAWHQLNVDKYLGGTLLYKIDQSSKRIYLSYSANYDNTISNVTIADFSSIVNNIETISVTFYTMSGTNSDMSGASISAVNLSIGSPASIVEPYYMSSGQGTHIGFYDGAYFTYDSLR